MPQRRRLVREAAEARPALVLQPRDLDVLAALHDHRFLDRELLLQLFPPGPRPAHLPELAQAKQPGTNLDRRLAKLFHHGYLDRRRTQWGGAFFYALSTPGAQLLAEARGLVLTKQDRSRKNREVRDANLEHTVMIARFRIALTTAAPLAGLALDRFHREGKDLRADWRVSGGRRRYVVPDAFLTLQDPSRPDGRNRLPFFVEVDRGTMPLERMAEKFTRYAEFYAHRFHQQPPFDVRTFQVLIITRGAERAGNLRDLLGTLADIPRPVRERFYFTDDGVYRANPVNVLASVWLTVNHAAQRTGIVPSPLPRG